jgi:hypothetical protein
LTDSILDYPITRLPDYSIPRVCYTRRNSAPQAGFSDSAHCRPSAVRSQRVAPVTD